MHRQRSDETSASAATSLWLLGMAPGVVLGVGGVCGLMLGGVSGQVRS